MQHNMSCVGLAVSENTLLADRDLAEIEDDAQKKLGYATGGETDGYRSPKFDFAKAAGYDGTCAERVGPTSGAARRRSAPRALKIRRILEYR